MDNSFLELIIIGAYGAYPTLAAIYVKLRDQIEELRQNHLKHLDERITALEEKLK